MTTSNINGLISMSVVHSFIKHIIIGTYISITTHRDCPEMTES